MIMTGFSRRQALLAGGATLALAACAPKASTKNHGAGTNHNRVKPLGWMDGTEMASHISMGHLSPLEETKAAITRAKLVNPQINAIATDTFDQALKDAEALPKGALTGVPTFIKDLMEWKGTETLWGSRAFRGNISQGDAPFAAAWRRAGVVNLGKSTSPEMGLISSTEPLVTGATRNPWDTSRMPGGSSGGAAALVAARVVPFAHASDGGGSIRIPASTCGVFGLKPSRGRLHARETAAEVAPPPVDISVSHAVTVSVRDSINLFRIAETENGPYAKLGKIEPLKRRLKIAYAPMPPAGTPLHPDTKSALDEVAKFCAGLGHTVEDFTLPIDGEAFVDRFLLLWAAGAADFARSASIFSGKPIGPEILEPWTLGLAGMYLNRQNQMAEALAYLTNFTREYDQSFAAYDVLLSPVTGSPALLIGEQAPDKPFDTLMASVLSFAAYTAPMNVAGAPSMSVPLSWSPSGLPIGAMFSARGGDDALLFELALELEAARPWADRRPPVSAF
jgi:amidase